MMKLCLILAFLTTFLLTACATTDEQNQAQSDNVSQYPTGTPSPLNTSANPWSNVNPQITGAATAARP
jgi:ABC-type Zn uptake system ZnuABC Zn-binding protein ZnuA